MYQPYLCCLELKSRNFQYFRDFEVEEYFTFVIKVLWYIIAEFKLKLLFLFKKLATKFFAQLFLSVIFGYLN